MIQRVNKILFLKICNWTNLSSSGKTKTCFFHHDTYVSPGTKLLSSWLELELNFNFVFFVVTYHEIWQYFTITLQPPGIIVRVSIRDWGQQPADLNRSQYFCYIFGEFVIMFQKNFKFYFSSKIQIKIQISLETTFN